MRAVVWDGADARVIEHAPPEPAAHTAVVRVRLAGICATDLQLLKGYMGFRGVLGHEFVGTVESGPPEWRARRVVGEINFACGACTACAQGLGRHCPNRRVMGILNADGAFAEKVAVPVANLHAVPDGVTDDAAVFTEPLAAAFEILDQVDVPPATRSIVLGDGKLGLLVAQVLHQAGARVVVVGQHDDKLAIARRLGVDAVRVQEWDGTPADLVVEATGSATGFAAALAATRPRGTLVLKSTVAEPAPLNLAPLVINEVTVVGSRCGRFPPALHALEAVRVDVRPLVSHRFRLQDALAALQVAGSPGVLKVLLEP